LAQRRIRVAIVGAGLGGVACAVNLQRIGNVDLHVFEKEDGPGGVWWSNRYPGCEVDVDSRAYSYSFKPHDWSRTHASHSEVQGYVESVIERFELSDRLHFGVTVLSARWDDGLSVYEVETSRGSEGNFDVFVSCVGLLSSPNRPRWDGGDSFIGEIVHSSDVTSVDGLQGKRVALVGAGSTACQLGPILAPSVQQLDLYQREPGYVLPKKERELTRSERDAFLRRPVRTKLRRWRLLYEANKAYEAFDTDSRAQAKIRSFHNEYLRRTVDDSQIRDALTPTYPYGCKRPVFASQFYRMFNRPNVSLVPHAVSHLTSSGVVDATGCERPADVVIAATGFHAAEFLHELSVQGRGGVNLQDAWQGEPSAFLGMTVPGFPNFFILYGPNTNGGWSMIAQLERQSEVVARVVRRLVSGRVTFVDTSPSVARRYDRWIQTHIRKNRSATEAGCHNYYHTPSGKNVTQWPMTHFSYLVLTKVLPYFGFRWGRHHAGKAVSESASVTELDEVFGQ
jgi:cation diffusion facilitator CzcD-associated flavoprotein CzcO